jgi:hypothetical protein
MPYFIFVLILNKEIEIEIENKTIHHDQHFIKLKESNRLKTKFEQPINFDN